MMKNLRTSLIVGVVAASVAIPVAASASSDSHQVRSASSHATARGSGAPSVRTVSANLSSQAGDAQTMSGTTYDWGNRNGWWILNLSGMPVVAGQSVTVSATEVSSTGSEFIGSAHIHCENVSVTQGKVSALCLFDWGSPIHVRLHYTY